MRLFLLCCSLALIGLSSAHPTVRPATLTVNKRSADTTIYDADQTAPTAIPRIVIYVDQYNNQIEKKIQTLHILPLSMKPTPAPSPESNQYQDQDQEQEQDTSEIPVPKDYTTPLPATGSGDDRSTRHKDANEGPHREAQHDQISQPQPDDEGAGRQTQHEEVAPGSNDTEESLEKDESNSRPPPAPRGFGITYSPYTAGPCKDAVQVKANIDGLASAGYSMLRLYGVDCNQVKNVYAAAKPHGLRLWLGIFDMNDIASAVTIMADHLGGEWGLVNAVSVGNELVNNHQISAGELIGKIGEAKALLRTRGYRGPVLTVDTFRAVQEYPELCADEEVEICAINAHAFFDPNADAAGAGDWLETEVQRTAAAINNGKRIVVTETGWPWAGNKISADSKAVPGVSEQAAAISAIRSKFADRPSDIFLFTAYNDDWKDPGPFGIEQSFGIGGPGAGNGMQ